MTNVKRRQILTAATGAAALAAMPAFGQSPYINVTQTLMPRQGSGPRIVIAGGGWGGLTAARYLREYLPQSEVIVVERNPVFWSCPISNKWLINVVDTDYIMHDMNKAANQFGYQLIQGDVIGFDRDRRQVHTSKGRLDYDFLILAGGIRNAYDMWFGNDMRAAEYTRKHFPSAYIPSAEAVELKRKVQNLKGGTLVMTLPPPPHRCPPSPYERACAIAWHMKHNKIPGKIVILDPKPRIAPITGGFTEAFEELYPDIIQHVPNATIKEVDPFKKRISTAAGDFDFDDAILMPPHQAADMVWAAGLINDKPPAGPNWWGHQHPTMLHAIPDDRVYLIGDCMGFISPQFGHYPKSAHVANAMGKIAATYISKRVKDEELVPILPDNLCYMMVNASPLEAVSVQFDYAFAANGDVHQTQIDVDMRSKELIAENFVWAQTKWKDFLG